MGPNIVFDGTGDLTNVADPKLGPLADNGGDTLTHALLPAARPSTPAATVTSRLTSAACHGRRVRPVILAGMNL